MKRERRRILAEHDFVGAAEHEIGERFARARDQLVGLFARRIAPVRVGVVMEEVIVHRRDDRARDLRAARAVEVRDGVSAVRPLQRRKVRTNFVDADGPVRVQSGDGRHAISTPAHCSTIFTASTWSATSPNSLRAIRKRSAVN